MFKKGDVVKLKSGGPPMTVEVEAGVGILEGVVCVWFDEFDRVRREKFEVLMLESSRPRGATLREQVGGRLRGGLGT